MKSIIFSIIILFLTITANADEVKGVDYCHDDKISDEWVKMLADFPNDPIIIKLAGLREGLCLMIDRKQISHEQGTDIWEDERQSSIVDRSKDEYKQMPKFTL